MKKNLLSVFFAVMVFSTAFSQVPSTFNYQAVVRDASGEILANKTVSFKISLLQGSETGTVIYSETHSLSTNDYGLVNLKIGEGTKISGDFSPVGWGDVIFTKVEIDPAGGSSYSHLATTKLSSVPYAFKAQTVEGLNVKPTGDIIMSGKLGIGTSSPSHNIDIVSSSATLSLKATGANAIIYLDRKSSTRHAYLLHRTGGSNNFYVGLLGDDDYWINSGSSSTFKGLKVKPTGDVAISNDLSVNARLDADEIFCNSNLEVSDDLTVGSITISAGEIQKTSTGTANMIPIAYGSVKSDGTIIADASSGNFSVSHPSTGNYQITITGVTYDYLKCAQSVTLIGAAGFVRTGSASGKLLVYTYDVTGDDIADKKNIMFSFVVYKP